MTKATPTSEKTILLTTTDTLPQPFTTLDLLTAVAPLRGLNNLRAVPEASEAAKADLTRQATELGADAVIGIRVNFYHTSGLVLTGTAVRHTD